MQAHPRLTAAILCVVICTACVKLTIPATVKQVSGNGIHLMQAVQAMATAVEHSEDMGAIPRDKAIKVMATLLVVTDAAQQVVKYLNLMMLAKTPNELNSTVDAVIKALEIINTGLFQALIPIQDETLKTDIGLLAAEIGRTITIINREILGRTYIKEVRVVPVAK